MHNRFRTSSLRLAAPLTATVLAVAAASLVACSSSGSAHLPGGSAASDETTGTVGLELTLPGGALLSTVNYTITGPNGASTVLSSGSVGVQNSTTVSFLLGGIPAGSWNVALSGAADGGITCTGSGTFTISARATTQVLIAMQCSVAPVDAGAASVTATLYSCGTANAISASPAEVTVGHSLLLTGTGTGPNPGGVTYQWSAPSGTFDTPTASSVNFTCTATGTFPVTLTVGDGPVPDGGSCDPTLSKMTVPVQCD
jgi:hypothetical protein